MCPPLLLIHPPLLRIIPSYLDDVSPLFCRLLPSSNESSCWLFDRSIYQMILIFKSGISGIVFLCANPSYWWLFPSCLSLLSMHLHFPPNVFLSFCQCSLNVNAPIYQCVCSLIDYNIDIDSWDFWIFSVCYWYRPSCLCVLSICCVNSPFV